MQTTWRLRAPLYRTLLRSSTPMLEAYHAITAAAVFMGAILPCGLRKRAKKAGTGAPDAASRPDATHRLTASFAGRAGRRTRHGLALSGVPAVPVGREAMGGMLVRAQGERQTPTTTEGKFRNNNNVEVFLMTPACWTR